MRLPAGSYSEPVRAALWLGLTDGARLLQSHTEAHGRALKHASAVTEAISPTAQPPISGARDPADAVGHAEWFTAHLHWSSCLIIFRRGEMNENRREEVRQVDSLRHLILVKRNTSEIGVKGSQQPCLPTSTHLITRYYTINNQAPTRT